MLLWRVKRPPLFRQETFPARSQTRGEGTGQEFGGDGVWVRKVGSRGKEGGEKGLVGGFRTRGQVGQNVFHLEKTKRITSYAAK